jgi:hypothetical protein
MRIVMLLMIGALCEPTEVLTEELGFAGAGAQNCAVLIRHAVPGRGSSQNDITTTIFS